MDSIASPLEDASAASLIRWLEQHVESAHGPWTIHRLTAGYSNLTWRVRSATQDLVVRQAPPGVHVAGAHDMEREYRFMSALSSSWPRVPRVLALCQSEEVLGSRFFVMPFVAGRALGTITDPDEVARACRSLASTMAELHALDVPKTGLTTRTDDPGFGQRQVVNAVRRYRAAERRHLPAFEDVLDWLGAQAPQTQRLVVTHNDFRFDNLIFDDTARVRAVLDWEMATVGDPGMDLGMALAYWVQPDDAEELRRRALGPTLLAGAYSRDGLVRAYEDAAGHELAHRAWYEALGLARLIVILQQLETRAALGLSADTRFAALAPWIDALAARAIARIEED